MSNLTFGIIKPDATNAEKGLNERLKDYISRIKSNKLSRLKDKSVE